MQRALLSKELTLSPLHRTNVQSPLLFTLVLLPLWPFS